MKNYYRQFITLLQERPGYAMPGKQAVGRIVIEARDDMAKATVYLQDISPQNSYKLAVISQVGDRNLGIVLGSIFADERGRYEGKFEFDRGDIGGRGITCEGIDACAVILSGDDGDLAAPLVGYKAKPFSWRVNLSFPDGKASSPIVETAEVLAEEVPPSVYAFDTEYVFDAEYAFDTEEPEPVPETQPKPISELFTDGDAIEVDVFKDARWIVTTLQKLKDCGHVESDILENPNVMDCSDKHQHILLGRKADEGQDIYILGIPDVYDSNAEVPNREFEKMFDSFKLCSPDDAEKNSHGYWLKHI